MTLEDLERFHADISAAILAHVPVEISRGTSSRQSMKSTLAQLEQFGEAFRRRLAPPSRDTQSHTGNQNADNKERPSEANLFHCNDSVPARYTAALHAFANIGSMPPIIDCLACRRIAQNQVQQALRPMWYYLAALTAAGLGGLFLFSTSIEPVIDSMRADISLIASNNRPADKEITSSLASVLLPVLVLLVLGFVIWAWCGGFRKLSAWLGGDTYCLLRCKVAGLNLVHLLTAGGVSNDDAIAVGSELTEIALTHDRVISSFSQSKNVQIENRTRYLEQLALRRLGRLRKRVPTIVVATYGGILCVGLGLFVFRPIVDLLVELGGAIT